MISEDALDALKLRNPVHAVAGQYVSLRILRRGRYVGPCPICSDDPRSRTAMRFECDADKWVCAVCADGGDVIKLVAKREGLSFRAAVDRLGGGAEEKPTPALARRAGRRAFAEGGEMVIPDPFAGDDALRVAWCAGWTDGRKADQYATFARARERERLLSFWEKAQRWPGTPVADYLACRGLIAPGNAFLRCHPDMPMFADGREREPLLVHRGPAMLAPFYDAEGEFRGLHITWIDTARDKCKAVIVHPHTGEVLPSKKMRGSKTGCYLPLGGERGGTRMVTGEGIETVLAAYTSLVRADRSIAGRVFRAAGDLGNLAGKAVELVPHPTLKTTAGRAQRVPGPHPDLNSPAMPVPDSVTELVLLGDGDSEPFLTRNALERAARRHARPGRTIRVPFAPAGLDFNDVIQGKSNEQ